ncbi:MAG: hypothetical protein ABS76_07820 [Pelagibacterium sp. SCN 64-44]|nr:MAG: hypothetical protein ABS76_07820 [Pelagibacterium sp. SCN 64-44]
MLLWNGERGWTVGVIGVVILLPPCLIIAMWIAHYRNSVGKFLNMSTHRADFVLSDQKFGIISDLGEAKLPWATITEVWEKPEYWMLFTGPNQFMTLPMLTFSSADREFLRSKLISAMYRA